MAALWQMLREEVRATVDDFRDKGAIGTLKDVALDTRDMATSMGGGLINGVKDLVSDEQRYVLPVLQVEGAPVQGTVAPLRFEDGTMVQATVVEVNANASPPRAKVAAPGLGQLLDVEVRSVESRAPIISQEMHTQNMQGETSLLDLFVEECRDTVKDIRIKGAVSAVRDAAHDAVDILGTTASKAVSGARSLATPLIPDIDTDTSEVSTAEATASSSSTAPATSSTAPTESVNLLDLPLFDTIKEEWSNTVQDVREKGAIGAVKDAALDAADIVGSMAKTAVHGAKSIVSGISDQQNLEEGERPAFTEEQRSQHDRSTEDETVTDDDCQGVANVKKLVEDYEESLRAQETPQAKRPSRPSEDAEEQQKQDAEELID